MRRRMISPSARRMRGMTLIEVIIAISILAMISLLLYGAFDSLSRGKRGEAMRADRSRQGREAMSRIVREMSSAYLSLHAPLTQAQLTRRTAMIGERGTPGDRIDFASFAHRRLDLGAAESDQAEIGYFVAADPAAEGKNDLVRREQTPIDTDTRVGGNTQVLAEDIELFEIRYYDPTTGQWLESWDTTQSTGQFNRLPYEVKVTLVLKGIKDGDPLRYQTKFIVPVRDPLTFGQPR
jgi:general secretion pathway protein J